jgi:hypothetical protein
MSPNVPRKFPERGRPAVALDGSESLDGRALFVLSALHWCLDWLPAVDVRMIDVVNEDVRLAADVFRWDHGIDLRVEENAEFLASADLYAAATFRSVDHLRLPEARRAGVRVLLTVEFPDDTALASSVLFRRPAAFDPRLFARELGAIVTPWL